MSTPAPFFSVVIPVFNRADSIRPTLESVRAQSFTDFECLVVDDGSADGDYLAQVVAGLADPRFFYLRRANGGGGAARNTGIGAARGLYLAFLDSDDLFFPSKLGRVARELDGLDPATAVYSQVSVDRGVARHWIKPSRPIAPGEDVGEYMFVHNHVIQTSSIVVATEIARRVRFDPELRKGQDLDFCIRLQRSGIRFHMIAEPLAVWRDVTEHNRTSRVSGYEQPLAWLEANRARLSPRAVSGYRANVLAYHVAPQHRLRALGYLFEGLLAGVAPRIVGRQLLRCLLPRRAYRQAVNLFVSMFGGARAR